MPPAPTSPRSSSPPRRIAAHKTQGQLSVAPHTEARRAAKHKAFRDTRSHIRPQVPRRSPRRGAPPPYSHPNCTEPRHTALHVIRFQAPLTEASRAAARALRRVPAPAAARSASHSSSHSSSSSSAKLRGARGRRELVRVAWIPLPPPPPPPPKPPPKPGGSSSSSSSCAHARTHTRAATCYISLQMVRPAFEGAQRSGLATAHATACTGVRPRSHREERKPRKRKHATRAHLEGVVGVPAVAVVVAGAGTPRAAELGHGHRRRLAPRPPRVRHGCARQVTPIHAPRAPATRASARPPAVAGRQWPAGEEL